ncbi:hypothetical protein V6N13_019641 [Hibiscus sabdariffa]
MEWILDQMECVGARRLGCVVSLLQGDAYSWWMTTKAVVAEADATWEYFRTAFKRKYLGPQYQDARKREFMALVQGRMSVPEYEVKFIRLSQYAPELIPDERSRCNRFFYGLETDIKTYLLATDYIEFDVLVNQAKDTEESLGGCKQEVSTCMRVADSSLFERRGKRLRDGQFRPECRRGCGAKDHRKRDYPKFAGGSSGHAVVVDTLRRGRGKGKGPF